MTDNARSASELSADFSIADIRRLYAGLFLVRSAEEEVARVYPSDKIKSPIHLSIGQEAVSVGVCDALRSDDVVGSTYRGHAAYLAKGGDLGRMVAEMYGKETGCAQGKGGSMHLVSAEQNFIGSSAVVGTGIPVAMGYSLAIKQTNSDAVVVCFFGDGATEEGVFYESLNFASLHQLPIMFVCENNGLAIHTPLQSRWATDRLCERVETFGLRTHQIDDGDIFSIRAFAAQAVDRIRNAGGPEFLECKTYRWREHVGPAEDFDAGYRNLDEVLPWRESDQVGRLAEMLSETDRDEVEAEVKKQISAAFDFAEASDFPGVHMLESDVFAP